MDIKDTMQTIGQQARLAGREISRADSLKKNQALLAIADEIAQHRDFLVAENQKDLIAAKQQGLDTASLDRLALTPASIQAMVEGLKQVAALPDPVGEISDLVIDPAAFKSDKCAYRWASSALFMNPVPM